MEDVLYKILHKVVIDDVYYGHSPVCLIRESDISERFKKEHLKNALGSYMVVKLKEDIDTCGLHLIDIKKDEENIEAEPE